MALQAMSPGRKRGGRRAYRPLAEINVTPFVDVMLVLLIVFMVTAPLLTAGLEVDLPDAQAPALAQDTKDNLQVFLKRDRSVVIQEHAVPREKLVPMLREISKGNTELRVFVHGDQALDYGYVMGALGDIYNGGFQKVALVTDPQKGQ